MQITVVYETQLKRAAGVASETVDVVDGCTVADVVRAAAEQRGSDVKTMILDTDGNIRPSVLIFRGDDQMRRDSAATLNDGDTITLMSPISGG